MVTLQLEHYLIKQVALQIPLSSVYPDLQVKQIPLYEQVRQLNSLQR